MRGAAQMHEAFARTLSPLFALDSIAQPGDEPVDGGFARSNNSIWIDGSAGSPPNVERFRFNIPEHTSWPDFAAALDEHVSPLLPDTPLTAYWKDGERLYALRNGAHLGAFVDHARRSYGGQGEVVVVPSPVSPLDRYAASSRLSSPPQTVEVLARPVEKVVRWKKGKRLGSGSFGVVFQAIDEDTGGIIAVKQIELGGQDKPQQPSQQGHATTDLAELRGEIELLRSISHKNVVQYLGTQQVGSFVFIFMEFMAGGSLAELARQCGGSGLPARVIQQYTKQILEGLCYLHCKGIVHRDIKGDNILCEGASGVVKLADFGAAKRLQQVATMGRSNRQQLSGLKGTVLFLSPEVIQGSGHYSPASDVWALGCTVIELATAHPPWRDCKFDNEFSAIYHIAKTTSGPSLPPGLLPPVGEQFLADCFLPAMQRPRCAVLLNHPFLCRELPHRPAEPASPVCGRSPGESGASSFTYDHSGGGTPGGIAETHKPDAPTPLAGRDRQASSCTQAAQPGMSIPDPGLHTRTTASEIELGNFFGGGPTPSVGPELLRRDTCYSTFTSPPPTEVPGDLARDQIGGSGSGSGTGPGAGTVSAGSDSGFVERQTSL
eukprot:Hpha_TRINITY_DN13347_c0_g1::TRINITY_DN13347_c0_g1_i3::g.95455::m.95455